MNQKFIERVGEFGGSAITFYSGYLMTQFQEHPKVAFDEHLAPIIRVAGYALMGYGVYDFIRTQFLVPRE